MSDILFLVFHEKVIYERLTACAKRYLSFEAEFLMRSDAKSVSPPPTHPKKLFILSSICTSMHNCMETKVVKFEKCNMKGFTFDKVNSILLNFDTLRYTTFHFILG